MPEVIIDMATGRTLDRERGTVRDASAPAAVSADRSSPRWRRAVVALGAAMALAGCVDNPKIADPVPYRELPIWDLRFSHDIADTFWPPSTSGPTREVVPNGLVLYLPGGRFDNPDLVKLERAPNGTELLSLSARFAPAAIPDVVTRAETLGLQFGVDTSEIATWARRVAKDGDAASPLAETPAVRKERGGPEVSLSTRLYPEGEASLFVNATWAPS
ncbi:MAG: hypothetical protein ACT4PW_14025 [Acidimicrobiia bacterium]